MRVGASACASVPRGPAQAPLTPHGLGAPASLPPLLSSVALGAGPGAGVGAQPVAWPCLFQAARLAKMKIPPSEMFLSEGDKYSRFDENVRTAVPFRTGSPAR